jgi:UDP-N-acetylglucosamine transferase subunit ALG13
VIFVTVGTHEQSFDRLVSKIDEMKKTEIIKEEVFIQIGYSKYIPEYCEYAKIISYIEIMEKIQEARIVITHGGPGSIMPVLYKGKIPIVVPRQKKYDEHIDDHQVFFTKKFEEKGKILTVYDIEELEEKLKNYDEIVGKLKEAHKKEVSPDKNIQRFAQTIEEICSSLLNKKKKRVK